MGRFHRRSFLQMGGATVAATFAQTFLREVAAIAAQSESRTIADVKHVVILHQENRSFDHYFGTFRGVRGFGDRFTIPQANAPTVWHQRNADGEILLPYRLDSNVGNAQRSPGTPHGWIDGQLAWNRGCFGRWPQYKTPQSMAHYTAQEAPFQFALAEAFTLCDAYHCSILSCTTPNRLFAFTGTNDPFGKGGGPAIDNTNDQLGPIEEGYRWTTYAERLQAAGVSWKVYQDVADNFEDNPLLGFRTFREAAANAPDSPLARLGASSTLTNKSLEGLRRDVTSGALPQVSWIVAPADYSEHPSTSCPAQGGYYTQQVIEALTADPEVWSKTVLFVTYDENDGFFDHMPPPCPPSYDDNGVLAGASTLDDASERHPFGPFGPGMRVPMFVVSPFSRGGWINSQSFDHTSIIRFLEARFGVIEPNISPFRRAMNGDLTSAFDFVTPNTRSLPTFARLTRDDVDRIRDGQEQLRPIDGPLGGAGIMPQQERGVRPSRALDYKFEVVSRVASDGVALDFVNRCGLGAVFHVYDRKQPEEIPRRYAVEATKQLSGTWPLTGGAYDLWVLGPNGFHRRYEGASDSAALEASVDYDASNDAIIVCLKNTSNTAKTFIVSTNAYSAESSRIAVDAHGERTVSLDIASSGRWYDLTVHVDESKQFHRRFAGRWENGKHSTTDPAFGFIDAVS